MTSTVRFKLPVYVCLRIIITVMSCHVHLGLWLFVIFVSILFISLSFKKRYWQLSAPISIFFNHSPRSSCPTCVFTFLFCLSVWSFSPEEDQNPFTVLQFTAGLQSIWSMEQFNGVMYSHSMPPQILVIPDPLYFPNAEWSSTFRNRFLDLICSFHNLNIYFFK